MPTVDIYPSAAGPTDGPAGKATWQNPQNALVPDGGKTYCHYTFPPNTVGSIGRWKFERVLPPYARISAIRLHVVGAAELSLNSQILVGTYALESPDGTWAGRQSDRVAFTAPSFSELSVSGKMQPLIDDFNSRPGLISKFSLCLVSSRALNGVSETLKIDSFFLRTTYATPPAPWKGRIHIQGKPMQTQAIKQGSNRPFVQVSVTDANGDPLDLRGATLTLKAVSSQKTIEGEVTLTDAANGKGIYEWRDGDTDTPGVYRVELTSEWLDGSVVKIPHDRMMLFEVVPSL